MASVGDQAKQRKDQVTLFATIGRILVVASLTVVGIVCLLSLLGLGLLSSSSAILLQNLVYYGFIGVSSLVGSLVVVAILTFLGWIQPPFGWIPPTKRARDCGRRRFPKSTSDDTENEYDIVIIGSGISGLTTAAILVQMGYRVCVLEAHEVAGGSTHEFCVDGKSQYSFPSGLHYVIPHCQQVLQLSCGAKYPTVTFPKLGNAQGIYERIRLPRCIDPKVSGDASFPDLPIENERQLRKELHARYPGLKIQLERYESLATAVLTCFPLYSALHLLPWSIREPLAKTVLPEVWWKYASRSAEDVLQELFADAPASEQENVYQLQAYLCALWVDTGCPPHRVSFFMIAAVSLGFPHEGGAFPAGGSKAMAATLVERIEEGNHDKATSSNVYCRAPVQQILTDEVTGAAIGVKLSEQHCGGTILKAKKGVVTACGWRNTARLMSKSIKNLFHNIQDLPIPQGEGFCMANVGINASADEVGLECCNLWPQPAGKGLSIFDGVRNYLENPVGVPPTEIPLMITFPTLKDRLHKRDSKYQTAQVLALAKTEWFGVINDKGDVDDRTQPWKHPERSPDYENLKQQWHDRLLEAFLTYYPQLKGKIEMFDVSTPLSIEHYLPTGSGSAIGLDVNAGPASRFTNLETMKMLDMKTPVPRLWMTGQDTLLCGVPLAQAAGLMTALRIAGPLKTGWFMLRGIWLLVASIGEEMRKSNSGSSPKKQKVL